MPAPRTVLSVVGARPNFMKIAPIAAELARRGDAFRHVLVHTGQHYDDAMSAVFLEELGVGEPDFLLNVGSGTHAQQTARVMERLEPVLEQVRPDIVLVPGDVNSTLAAALVAAKLGLPVGHVEAGLRSFDRTMPEEVNRVVADSVSDHLFIHSPEARDHLLREGAEPARIHDVGNTMIDSLVAMRDRVRALDEPGRLGLRPGGYLLATLHRPALVDGPLLGEALARVDALSAELPVVFPVHPRTQGAIDRLGWRPAVGVTPLPPAGYLAFLSLLAGAAAVLTDSGGVQEEATYLGIPCFTLRETTERPVTCTLGTNTLLGLAPQRISELPELLGTPREWSAPPGWDGRAAERLVDVLTKVLGAAGAEAVRVG